MQKQSSEFLSHDKQFPEDGYYINKYEDGFRIQWYDGVEGFDREDPTVFATRADALRGILADWEREGNYEADLIDVKEALASA